MCGLIGYVVTATSGGITQDVNIFTDMLFMDTLRGHDSTGVGMYGNKGEMRLLKSVGPAHALIPQKEYVNLMADFVKEGKALIGHNRKATVGKVMDTTAHPFLIPENDTDTGYMFMHNGSLRNWEKLVDGVETEVDSEMLGHLLAKCNGDKEKIQEALGKVHGAYACIWFDQTQDNMYIVRNSERPLVFGETKWGLLISSEAGIMAAAANRNNCKVEKFINVEADTLYCISLERDSKAEITEEKLTIKKAMPPTTTSGRAASTSSAVADCNGVSKNYFKKIREEYIGNTLGFWLNDWEPKVIGDPNCTSWLIWGINEDDYLFPHRFQATINGFTQEQLVDEFDTVPFYGVVEECIYNKADKSVTFVMKRVKAMSSSMQAALMQ